MRGLLRNELEGELRHLAAVWFPRTIDEKCGGFLRDAALYGFRYIKERMRDPVQGGWYRMLDQQEAPLEGNTKHGHGYSCSRSAATTSSWAPR